VSERRPFQERVIGAIISRPYHDETGHKGAFGRFAHAQPHVVRRYELTLPGWPRFARPLRIAFLSDFHVGSHTGDLARLAAIAKEAEAYSPDLVLYGGDYMNMHLLGRGRVPPRSIAAVLSRLTGRCGRFAVLGNHDYIYGRLEVDRALRAAGIVVIEHGQQAFTYEQHSIDVVGVPDAHVQWQAAKGFLAGLTRNKPAIILTHDPARFAEVPDGPFLTLAGHTHGGQIKFPVLGVLMNASRAPLRWSHGHVAEGGRHLIVTAGLGTSTVPLRIGVPPEYAIIDVTGP
jgi:predicted MPP superfamily phosphohydrolase